MNYHALCIDERKKLLPDPLVKVEQIVLTIVLVGKHFFLWVPRGPVAYVISILVLDRGNLVNGIRLREHQRKSRIPKLALKLNARISQMTRVLIPDTSL